MRINTINPSFKGYYKEKNEYKNIEITENKSASKLSYIETPSQKDLITYIKPLQKAPTELLEGQFLGTDNQIFNRGTTEFARPDIDWGEFKQYLQNRFQDKEKVNVFNWACSTGEETLTLAMLLKSSFKDSDKFFPIKAGDIDNDRLISNTIRQKIGTPVNYSTCFRLQNSLALKDDDIKRFFKQQNHIIYINDEILNSIEYKFSNILTDLDSINSDVPSLIMARNMWLYVDSSKYEEFAQKLYDKLATGSTLVIGIHDCLGEAGVENSASFPEALKKAGFKPINTAKGAVFDCLKKCDSIIFEK